MANGREDSAAAATPGPAEVGVVALLQRAVSEEHPIPNIAGLPVSLLGAALQTGVIDAQEALRVAALAAGARAIPEIAPYLPHEDFPAALELASRETRESDRIVSMIALLVHAPPGMRRILLAEASPFHGGPTQGEFHHTQFGRAFPLLPAELRARVAEEAVAVLPRCGPEDQQARILDYLAPALAPDDLRSALRTARSFSRAAARIDALTALAQVRHDPVGEEAAPAALAELRALPFRHDLVERIEKLLPCLSASHVAVLVPWIATLPDASLRTAWLCAIGSRVPLAVAPEALAIARALLNPTECAQASARLLVSLPADLAREVSEEVLTFARSQCKEFIGQRVLRQATPGLPVEMLSSAWGLAVAIAADLGSVDACATLLPRLPVDLLPEAEAVASRTADASSKVVLLSRLVARASGDKANALVREAWKAAKQLLPWERGMEDVGAILARIWEVPGLPAAEEAVAAVWAQIPWVEQVRDPAFRLVLRTAPDARRREVVEAALRRLRIRGRAAPAFKLLTALLPHLPAESRPAHAARLVTAARTRPDLPAWQWAEPSLLRHLPTEELERVAKDHQGAQPGPDWFAALPVFVERLPAELLAEAMLVPKSSGFWGLDSDHVALLARRWPAERLLELMALLIHVGGVGRLRAGWGELAARLGPTDRTNALAAVARVPERLRGFALTALAPAFAESGTGEFACMARSLPTAVARARALVALQAHARRDGPELTAEALRAVRKIRRESTRLRFLRRIAGRLDEEAAEQAWAVAGWFRALDLRLRARCAVLPRLGAGRREVAAQAALTEAACVRPERTAAALWPDLVGAVPATLAGALQAAACTLKEPAARVLAVSAVLPLLEGGERNSAFRAALACARTVRDAGARAECLRALLEASEAPDRESVLDAALAAAGSIRDDAVRSRALALLADQVPTSLRSGVLRRALSAARLGLLRSCDLDATRHWAFLAWLFRNSVDQLEWLTDPTRMGSSLRLRKERVDLEELARRLPDELLPAALAVIVEIPQEGRRLKALEALAARLSPEASGAILDDVPPGADAWYISRLWEALQPRLPDQRMSYLVDYLMAQPTPGPGVAPWPRDAVAGLARWSRSHRSSARQSLARWAERWRSGDVATILGRLADHLPWLLAAEADPAGAAAELDALVSRWSGLE